MKLARILTLATVALTFALGTAFAQTTPTAAKTTAKPATMAKTPAAKATAVALKDIPAAVKDAVTAAYPKGTISKATKTGADKDVVYSVSVKDGKTTKVVKVSADGKIQK